MKMSKINKRNMHFYNRPILNIDNQKQCFLQYFSAKMSRTYVVMTKKSQNIFDKKSTKMCHLEPPC